MPGDPVQWMGPQAVVALPEHIDVSNAGQICEELLSVIDRGADVLIADMTATVSCDPAGADAVARAHQRAVFKGTQLRLVVTAQAVRRVLGFSDLGNLVSVYSSLGEAIAAGEPAADAAVATEQAHRGQELLDRIVHSLFHAGLSLQAVINVPHEVDRKRISEALQRLEDTIRQIRDRVFSTRPDAPPPPGPPDGDR
jgi:anti-anti-sigma regulatory factor